MKTQLTKEQSQHLIELGVPFNKARVNYSAVSVDSDIKRIVKFEYFFTLTDLLEILPKEIRDGYVYWLKIDITNDCSEVCYFAGAVANKELGYKIKEELIDALYELLCWVIENGYLKLN